LTIAGTIAVESELDRDISSPPSGAAELIVTVPTLDLPPVTVPGFRASETR
jgi:hypothetical protein